MQRRHSCRRGTLLAVIFGRHILRLAEKPAVEWAVIVLIVVFFAGSTFSIVRWTRLGRG